MDAAAEAAAATTTTTETETTGDTTTNEKSGGGSLLTNLPGTGGGTTTTTTTNADDDQKKKKKLLAIVYTCTVCNTRSAKQFTDRAYRHGVVVVKCPGCGNLHLIADRLGIFENHNQDGQDGGWDIETAMAKMGENVTVVNNDNVLELTLQDWMGDEKMGQLVSTHNGDDKAEKKQ